MGADRDALAELLDRGFEDHARSPPARQRAAVELPAAIADALAREARRDHPDRLRAHWAALVARQAGSTAHGWDALMSAAAVVLELVLGSLPGEVEQAVAGLPTVQVRFAQLRAPFQRFALVVDHEARCVRTFVAVGEPWADAERLRCPPDLEHHPGLRFQIDAGAHEGRSHTLLLALLALERWGGLALPRDIPFAATGAMDADGCTIAPVAALAEKRRAWFAQEPGGLLLSAPPRSTRELRALLRGPHTQRGQESLEAPKDDDPSWTRWIVAGTLEEARAKLDAWSSRPPAIPSWDGRALAREGIASATLDREDFDQRSHPLLNHEDPVLSALWHLEVDRPGARGVVLYGEPGIGKSVLSHLLATRFTTGLLGTLGFAVRRSARELAEDVASMPGAPLSALLARREPERLALFERLIQQERLHLILDGLDEVAARVLHDIARPIHEARAWYVATSRDVRQGHDALPPHLSLKFRSLDRDQAVLVLRKLGRDDLGAQVDQLLSRSASRDSERDPIGALCRTPFHLHLLANAVTKGARIDELDPADLYRKAFAGLLEQAVVGGRLRADDADVLRRQGRTIAGELALAWLRSPAGILTDAEVSARLERAGFVGRAAVDMQRALEFGYLLTPGADNLEFTHRTFAEWAAAGALVHRVKRRAQGRDEEIGRISAADRASVEHAVLDPILAGEGTIHESRLWQLLRFYAPESLAPLALVETIVGPASLASWLDAGTASRAFAAALEIAARAPWTDRDEAQTALGLFARSRLFPAPPDGRHVPPVLGEHADLERFVRAVGSHLPAQIDALIDLVARTPQQRAALQADPTRLLQFCPRELHAIFEPLLRAGTPTQQAAILERHVQWSEEPPADIARRLVEELPGRLRVAYDAAAAARREAAASPYEPGEPASAEQARWESWSVLQRMETALFMSGVRTGRGLPWRLVQRRLLDWPHHLQDALLAWFRAPPQSPGGGAPHRREALSLLVTGLGEIEAELLDQCRAAAAAPEARAIAGHLYDRIDAEDSSEPWRMFKQVARRAGWDPDHERQRFGRDPPPCVDRIVETYRAFTAQRKPLALVLRALVEAGSIDGLVGELWPLWLAGSKERRVLLHLLLDARRLPPCVGVAELIAHLPRDHHDLPYELDPARGMEIQPKHEAEWREIAHTGRGRARFLAQLWCAQRDGRPKVDAVAALDTAGDPELAQLADAELAILSRHADPAPAPVRAPEHRGPLPLPYRARIDALGWRDDLLSALEALPLDAEDGLHELLTVVRNRQVREALPILRRRFEMKPDLMLGSVLGGLLEPGDKATLRRLLAAGFVNDLSEASLECFDLDDLRFLLDADSVHAWSPRRDIWEHVVRLGAPAHPLLLAALGRRRGELEQSRAGDEPRRVPGVSDWIGRLEVLVLDTLDAETTTMGATVELLFSLVEGDRHQVFSTPGPLGSDYDDPSDLEYGSHQVNAGMIEAAKRALTRRLALHPEDAPLLARMFEHPSETLQLHAFEALVRCSPAPEVALLGVRALEGHLRSTDTRVDGETGGVLLAALSPGGSGSVDVRIPRIGRELAQAVERHLTHADRDVIFELTRHGSAAIRALACRWVVARGTPDWAAALRPAVEDESAAVVMSALRALLALDATTFAGALAVASRRQWSPEHYRACVAWLVGQSGRRAWYDDGRPAPAARLPPSVLRSIAADAMDAACAEVRDEAIQEEAVPSPLERLVARIDEAEATPGEGPLSSGWLHVRARATAGALQRALYRILARRGVTAIAQDLEPLLAPGGSSEALLAAEILPTLGSGEPVSQLLTIWETTLDEHPWVKVHELCPRVLYMLERAPAAYAPLLPRLFVALDEDHEGCLTEDGEEILERMRGVLVRWGPSGAGPLLDDMDGGPHARDALRAKELVLDVYRTCAEVQAELRRRAADSQEHASAVETIDRPTPAAALARLRGHLLLEILPVAWGDSSVPRSG